MNCFAYWDGGYAGLTGGYESGNAKIFPAEHQKIPSKWSTSNSLVGDFTFKGAKGEVLLGYGKTIGKYYLGGEASTTVYRSQGKAKHTSWDGFSGAHTMLSLRVLRNESFSISFGGGYKINDETLLYIKPGISSTKFNFTLVNRNDRDSEGTFIAGSSKRFNGLTLELGVEMRIHERFLLRVGGSHTFYRRKFFTAEETQCSKIRFIPQATQVKTGIIIPLFV